MIYEITKEIATALAAKGMPYPVVYGPERAPRPMVSARVVIERNRDASDSFEAPHKRAHDPPMVATLWQSCTARIFAYSTLAGAGTHDHEREAYGMLTPLSVALHSVVRKRNNAYRITSARLMTAQELALEGLEAWPGVVYRLDFAVDRAVEDVTWQGAAKDTTQLGSIVTTIDVEGDDATAGGSLPSAVTSLEG